MEVQLTANIGSTGFGRTNITNSSIITTNTWTIEKNWTI